MACLILPSVHPATKDSCEPLLLSAGQLAARGASSNRKDKAKSKGRGQRTAEKHTINLLGRPFKSIFCCLLGPVRLLHFRRNGSSGGASSGHAHDGAPREGI